MGPRDKAHAAQDNPDPNAEKTTFIERSRRVEDRFSQTVTGIEAEL